MEIKMIDAKELRPAPYNPRKIDSEMLERLVKNIKEFGMVDPLIINKDFTIIGGHQRFYAAEKLGMKHLPCILLNLSKNKEKILNLALNKITGEFDYTMLPDVLIEIDTGQDDIELTGFSLSEIEEIMTHEGGGQGEGGGEKKKRPWEDDLWRLAKKLVMESGDPEDLINFVKDIEDKARKKK